MNERDSTRAYPSLPTLARWSLVSGLSSSVASLSLAVRSFRVLCDDGDAGIQADEGVLRALTAGDRLVYPAPRENRLIPMEGGFLYGQIAV